MHMLLSLWKQIYFLRAQQLKAVRRQGKESSGLYFNKQLSPSKPYRVYGTKTSPNC